MLKEYEEIKEEIKKLKEVKSPWESHGKPKGKTKRATATIYAVCDVKWRQPKESDNCDVNAKKYIEKEWSEEAVGLDPALLKTATIWGSSNRTKYYKKWKKNLAVRRSSNDSGYLARFS